MSEIIKDLGPLYKKNSRGKIQIWGISVLKSDKHEGCFVLQTSHGVEGGKIQVTHDVISKGKNIGKANETTVLDQAIAEATAKRTKQIERKGYVEDKSLVDVDQRPGAEAMLAHRYDKYPDKITFPCIIQPKLDGHRCLAVVKGGKSSLFSRQRKPINSLPHINKAIDDLVFNLGISDIIFDGELYSHSYRERFEELTGFIRSKEQKDGHEVVEYHIYDMVSDQPYKQRELLISRVPFSNPLVPVESVVVDDDAATMYEFRRFRNQGYEGAILRNLNGGYEGKRSYNLQKVKEFMDAEFEIVGVEEGRGKMKGHAIFVCHTESGSEFRAKLKGSMDNLVDIFNNQEHYIGKSLTVMFQEYTKDGIPRFPVGLRIREDV